MAKIVKHKFVSAIPDGPDATIVRPSNWNDDHDVSGVAESGVNTDITSMTGITGAITSPDYIGFDTTYSTTLTAGQLGWDGNNTLAIGMAGGNVVQHIGEDTFFYVKASSAITKGQVCMFTGSVGASGVITAAPATGVTNGQYIVGVAAESIANNGFGLIQNFGELRNINTSAFVDGDILYYDSSVTGGFTKTFPTSGPIVTVAAVSTGNSVGGGVIQIRVSVTQRITASTGISVSQTASGATITNTSPSSGGTVTSVAATAGTGISITGSPITTNGTLNITNTAPDQTVVLNNGTGISVTGTYPNFTITNTSPSSGGTVTSITAGTGLSGGTITGSGTIAIDSTVATLSGTQTLTNKTITARVSSTTSISSPLADNSDNYDMYAATAQAGALTISADAGTPTDGRKIQFRFTCDATPRVITFTGGVSKGFKPVGVTMTASGSDFTYTLTASKTTYFGAIYNTSSARWEIVALSQEA